VGASRSLRVSAYVMVGVARAAQPDIAGLANPELATQLREVDAAFAALRTLLPFQCELRALLHRIRFLFEGAHGADPVRNGPNPNPISPHV
jgi:hypothetical protein